MSGYAAPVARHADISPLIHIGYHKTGSSWLQRHLFSAKARAGFTAFPKGRDGPINKLIVLPNALDFDAGAVRARFGKLILGVLEEGLRPVVSSERLSGHPMTGGYDSKELAERLAAVFPDGQVLIVIREQREAVLSTYRQYVKAGGPWSLRRFLDPPVDTRTRVRLFDLSRFAYHRLVRTYQGLFGQKRVLVLPYELLRSEPSRFVASIARFAGATLPPGFLDSMPVEDRPNLASSAAATRAKRASNRLVALSDLNPAPLVAAPRLDAIARRRVGVVDRLVPGFVAARLEQRDWGVVAEAVGDRFEESNRATSDLCRLDLADYGYAVPAESHGTDASGTGDRRPAPVGQG